MKRTAKTSTGGTYRRNMKRIAIVLLCRRKNPELLAGESFMAWRRVGPDKHDETPEKKERDRGISQPVKGVVDKVVLEKPKTTAVSNFEQKFSPEMIDREDCRDPINQPNLPNLWNKIGPQNTKDAKLTSSGQKKEFPMADRWQKWMSRGRLGGSD